MPTSYSEASQIIENHLSQNWTFTPIAWDNVAALDYGAPARPRLPEGSDPFIKAKILYNQAPAVEIGQSAIRQTFGNLAVDFYTRQDKGSDTNHANIDNLTQIFEYVTISDIVFRDIEIFHPMTLEGWYITPTMVRFYFNR